uniref:Uncharacterized protein n=1 Tax=Romanomermis culicivorax TaxID=13658 RepID=A0A915JMI5_ROMCU
MMTPLTSSASTADEPPPYRESINVNERYVRWAKQQPHQNDLSFASDAPPVPYAQYRAPSCLRKQCQTIDSHS